MRVQAASKTSFRQRVRVEQELIDGSAADVGCEAALDLMHQVRLNNRVHTSPSTWRMVAVTL